MFLTAVNYNPVFISIWVGLAHEATVKLQVGPADNRPVFGPLTGQSAHRNTLTDASRAHARACSRGYKLAKHAPVLLRQVRVYWGRHWSVNMEAFQIARRVQSLEKPALEESNTPVMDSVVVQMRRRCHTHVREARAPLCTSVDAAGRAPEQLLPNFRPHSWSPPPPGRSSPGP